MRLVAGKVLMDINCPDELRDDPASAYSDSKALIERWHGKGRLGYAITPRFALTSSEDQLAAAGRLAAEYPDTWVHTHLAENTAEVEEIATQFAATWMCMTISVCCASARYSRIVCTSMQLTAP